MTRKQAREYVNSRLPYELEKARVSGFICPFCGNGSGNSGTGISSFDDQHYKCFVCDFYGDYLDILKKLHNTTKEWDIFSMFNLTIDSGQPDPAIGRGDTNDNRLRDNARHPKPESPPADYGRYYGECQARAGKTDYFQLRGISKEMVSRLMLGYDPAWKSPNAPNAPATARVIIPTSRASYTARATDPDSCYPIMKIGVNGLFNAKALQSADAPYIFIVEGEFDALSVIEVGGQCVGMGSISNVNKLIQAVKNNPPAATLVLALDNDEAGRKAQAVLKERLDDLKIVCVESNISGVYSDPNEALQKDRDGFIRRVKDPANQADKKAGYVKANSVGGGLDAFMRTVSGASEKAIPTGFSLLDGILDGGLYEGLYVIGAISSIGKTSLCLQMADQIAQGGTDVIIFSLEMSKRQLISKSLSRLTFIKDNGKDKQGFHYARTSRQITTWAVHSDKEKALTQEALQTYGEYSQNIYIFEGAGIIGADLIKQTVNEHVAITGKRPVVIVDYLQILTPANSGGSDKQNIDGAVSELKKMSMTHKIPVLAVSSFNRDNYMNPVNMASFKESGAIEYSSDVLLGLQFKGMDELGQLESKKAAAMKTVEEWRKADRRELELKIIKNRSGASGDSVCYAYYPKFNFFQEDVATKSENAGRTRL